MAVVVRPPELADVDRLARINIDTWRHAYAGIVPAAYLEEMDAAKFRERWRLNVTEGRPGVTFHVAEVDGVLAGYAIVGGYRAQEDADPEEDTEDWGEIFAIYTSPEQQRKGAGTALHDAAITALRDDDHRRAALWVLADNTTSQRWYEHRGWQADGVTSYWSGSGTPLPEIRMVRELDPG
jgi:ribosomal protein S18 acetylase RimI-like enzyme